MKALMSLLFTTSLFVSQIFGFINGLTPVNGSDPNAIVGDTYSIEEAREMVAPDSRLVFDELCSGAESVSIYIESLDVKENKIQKSDKLLANSLSDDNSALGNNSVMVIDKVISTESVENNTIVEKETAILALTNSTVVSGSFSASGQNYGIAASCTVKHSLTIPDDILARWKITFHSMEAQYTYLPSQQKTVTKLEYSVRLEEIMGNTTFISTGSANNPSSGVKYRKVINSGELLFGGETPLAMLTVYYSGGGSNTYEKALTQKR